MKWIELAWHTIEKLTDKSDNRKSWLNTFSCTGMNVRREGTPGVIGYIPSAIPLPLELCVHFIKAVILTGVPSGLCGQLSAAAVLPVFIMTVNDITRMWGCSQSHLRLSPILSLSQSPSVKIIALCACICCAKIVSYSGGFILLRLRQSSILLKIGLGASHWDTSSGVCWESLTN